MEIKEILKQALFDIECENRILFGSRARGDFTDSSDYDLLLIVADDMMPRQRMKMAHSVRERLAEHRIDADVIIKSVSETAYFKDKVGSIVQNALEEGFTV